MKFEFATDERIIFGPGTLPEAGRAAAANAGRALVVLGLAPERASRLLELLEASGVSYVTCSVQDEPSVETIQKTTRLAKEESCTQVIGFGGGSAIDTGKAVAAMLTNPGELMDYLEVIGRGQALKHPSAPMIAIPTTAGTGSEVTRNAVLYSPEHKVKVSLRSPYMLPNLALVDPELTYSLPPAATASTGLDALTQLIEPFVSSKANPLTDAISREGMQAAARCLPVAYRHGEDPLAREGMSIASLFGGLCLANAGLGGAHGFAGPLGGMFHAPHGALCARMLPLVMETNMRALRERDPGNRALKRYDEIAKILTGNERAVASDGVAWVQQLSQELGVPALSSFGVTPADIPEIVEKSAVSSSMKANPIQLTTEELTEILQRAL